MKVKQIGDIQMSASDQVSFTRMDQGSFEDYKLLHDLEIDYIKETPRRIIEQLALQGKESLSGYKISRLEHGLQSASRAEKDGADLDWIVAALIHDIGDGLSPQNHDRMAAEIIRPFVREEVAWVVEKHGIFQMKYYAHHYDWDPDKRDEFRNHPYWQSCADFCERWDQTSFDPDYPMKDLDHFAPMVHEVFSRKAWDDDVIKAGIVVGLPVDRH
jgi:predicted HD phosphohydrolase